MKQEIVLTKLDGSAPTKYLVTADEDPTYASVCEKLSVMSGVAADRVVFLEVCANILLKISTHDSIKINMGTVARVANNSQKVRAFRAQALSAYEFHPPLVTPAVPPIDPTSTTSNESNSSSSNSKDDTVNVSVTSPLPASEASTSVPPQPPTPIPEYFSPYFVPGHLVGNFMD